MNNIRYYERNKTEKRVLAQLLRTPSLLERYPLSSEDFSISLGVFNTIKEISKQSYRLIDKNSFVSAYVQRRIGEELDEATLAHKAGKAFDKYWAYGENLGLENYEADYCLFQKYGFLHRLRSMGINVSYYYYPEEQGEVEHMQRLHRFVNTPIADMRRDFIAPLLALDRQYALDSKIQEQHSSRNMEQLLHSLKQGRVYGTGHPSAYLTTITDGMKPGKLMITSAPTNSGKTRSSIASVCHAAMPCYYDGEKKRWMKNPNGVNNRVLFIVTETSPEEVQTAMLAYTANVDEYNITHNKCNRDESKRVELAANLFYRNFIWIVYMPEPTVALMEEFVGRYVKDFGVSLVFFDYIQSNQDLLLEYTGGVKGIQSREDQALANFAKQLKTMAQTYNVFIGTYTQTNADLKQSLRRDETVVAGAKAIINKADVALVMERPTADDMEAVKTLQTFASTPNMIYTVYKNRGAFNNIRIWVDFDLHCMRTEDCFVTDKSNKVTGAVHKTYLMRNAEGHLVESREKPEFPLTGEEVREWLETKPTVDELKGKLEKIGV